MSFWWWLQRKNYFLFMVREVSAVFVGLFALISLVGVYRLGQGEDAYQLYLSALQTPSARVLFVVILLFSLYHTVTWFYLTPMIMVVRIGSKTVPPILVLIANYLAWIVISLILFYLLVGV
jgi:fumarate reductase subunit C